MERNVTVTVTLNKAIEWFNSQLSVAKYTGGIRINGSEYILMDSDEPAAEGCFKPDLVRTDWRSLYTKLHRGIEQYIEQGLTPTQVNKIIKEENEKQRT